MTKSHKNRYIIITNLLTFFLFFFSLTPSYLVSRSLSLLSLYSFHIGFLILLKRFARCEHMNNKNDFISELNGKRAREKVVKRVHEYPRKRKRCFKCKPITNMLSELLRQFTHITKSVC